MLSKKGEMKPYVKGHAKQESHRSAWGFQSLEHTGSNIALHMHVSQQRQSSKVRTNIDECTNSFSPIIQNYNISRLEIDAQT